MTNPANEWPRALLRITLMVAAALAWSGIEPYDRLTWYLEIFPIAVALPLLYATARRFPLTPFLYWLIGFHCLILTLGAHYTYARVPLGFWVQDLFDFTRNNYDRLGHFVQGFVPAIAVREILKRESPVKGGGWLAFLTVAICLAISACYEFLEWWIAIAVGVGADEFLATQGDVWDTQWDMFLATCGAIAAIATLSRLHDRAIAKLAKR
jgi:putative membrane protein